MSKKNFSILADLVVAIKNSKRLKNKNFFKIKRMPIIQKEVNLRIELSEIWST